MILDPTGGQGERALAGASVALLQNGKANALALLEELGELLTARHGVARVVAASKPHFGTPAPLTCCKRWRDATRS